MSYRLGEPVPTFTAFDKATGAAVTVDDRTFDPEVHERRDPAAEPAKGKPGRKAES